MTDRVPQHPGRVRLTPVAGQTNVYDLELADGATVPGTPLNKANLLTDAVGHLIGTNFSGPDATTVNEALEYIASGAVRCDHGSYTGDGNTGTLIQISTLFNPRIVILGEGGFVWLRGVADGPVILEGNTFYDNSRIVRLGLTWSSGGVSFYPRYGSSNSLTMNTSGVTYHWAAFG